MYTRINVLSKNRNLANYIRMFSSPMYMNICINHFVNKLINVYSEKSINFTTLSSDAVKAITNLKESVKKPDKKKKNITRETLKNCQGHKRRYKLFGDREEFHNIDRDKNNLIIEPTDSFRAVITTSKNNVHIQVVNKSKNYKTIFGSFAGNVGFTKTLQQSERCAYRIGENIAKKCRRLGIFSIDIKFRRIMRVETVLQAMYANNLNITQIIHEPRLPKCGLNASKPRKRRRV
ncbi:mitochondrial ribosomal protein S11 precursor, putative [Plasmodium sp. gorilla clade G2]|uniref:mitochondrial ribosomal protein S11 precursor, putative n=1 Tax=Plasmodium sp. gorilla clade G2 TaxID=880535 RepID=UPI000D22096A|nr:mitochondrial ribosomal protein S11 precursor, putative [Plasmodium sp. gorilla clade G2]SOV19583.1 mitochondrial ribosomal protein S11 precursor, putative [Plasmodium sp. gorilla clade G2]